MSVRMYKLLWLAFAAVVGIFYVSGNLTLMAEVVFGFIVFGMVFMGMMVVLPTSISHPELEQSVFSFTPWFASLFRRSKQRLNESKQEWISSSSIEVRRPKLH